MRGPTLLILALGLAGAKAGCERRPGQTAATSGGASEAAAAPTNRVEINAAVRQNLGITFAKVESRNVGRTLRVPGRFELLPTARREYRVPSAGTIELLVGQYQKVEPGTPLYRLDAPRWRELQRELTSADTALELARAAADSIAPLMEAHERHRAEIQSEVAVWTDRVAALEELRAAGGARGEDVSQARAALATARARLAEMLEKEAELGARQREVRAQLEAARSQRAILLESAATLTGRTTGELVTVDNGRPRWQSVGRIEVVALSPGVIDLVRAISGSLVEPGAAVLTTVQPDQV
ncbi:MAG TPA: hypothetical protein VD963_04310, partial [Phycisphaerales bacterium]|nr:hypothetical protein [Phycisphaerales bacterium]